VATNHAGFSGTGFADYNVAAGSYVEWSVTPAQAGPVTLTIRHANGSTANRPLAISVNGEQVATVAFNGTGSWETWANVTVPVTLDAGANTIRATATTASGGPNVDFLSIG
jgi:hypothetical protein